MAAPTKAVFFHNFSRKTAAKNDPANRHAVNERIPEHASSTPTRPVGSTSTLPCCSIGSPSTSKTKATTVTTFLNKNRFSCCSTADTIGAETSHTNTGKTNHPVKRTRASEKTFDRIGDTASGAFSHNNGSNSPIIPNVIASVPGCEVPAPAR